MTPAQLEHLKKIDAHLERLLTQASKRTQGGWTYNPSSEHAITAENSDPFDVVIWTGNIGGFTEDEDGNFAASCAGNAEAGWKATRAAIAVVLSLSTHEEDAAIDLINGILTAFPLELIET